MFVYLFICPFCFSSPTQGSGGKSTTAKSSSGNGSPRTKPAPTPPRSRSLSSEPQKRRNTVSSTSPPSVTPTTLPAKVSSKNSLFTEPRSSLTNGHAVREQVPESAIELISTPRLVLASNRLFFVFYFLHHTERTESWKACSGRTPKFFFRQLKSVQSLRRLSTDFVLNDVS